LQYILCSNLSLFFLHHTSRKCGWSIVHIKRSMLFLTYVGWQQFFSNGHYLKYDMQVSAKVYMDILLGSHEPNIHSPSCGRTSSNLYLSFVEHKGPMLAFSLLQWCLWGLWSPGMWCHITEWLVSDAVRQHSHLKTYETNHAVTQHHIPGEQRSHIGLEFSEKTRLIIVFGHRALEHNHQYCLCPSLLPCWYYDR
jgi:hypothetical protein